MDGNSLPFRVYFDGETVIMTKEGIDVPGAPIALMKVHQITSGGTMDSSLPGVPGFTNYDVEIHVFVEGSDRPFLLTRQYSSALRADEIDCMQLLDEVTSDVEEFGVKATSIDIVDQLIKRISGEPEQLFPPLPVLFTIRRNK